MPRPVLPYSVNLWGSRPGDNDDCHTGSDFATLAEAEAAYAAPATAMTPHIAHTIQVALHDGSELWVELAGPDVGKARCMSPGRRDRQERAAREERRELAMEAGMAFGCDGFNDIMGWGE